MKFASMLRRLRNTQGGMGSTPGSGSTPYTPYTPVPPEPSPLINPPVPVPDMSRPTVTIQVPRPEIITHEPFNVTVRFSQPVNGFTQAELNVGGTSGASITAWTPDSYFANYVATITTSNWPGIATFKVAENVAINEFGFWNTASAEVTVDIPQESFNFTGLPPGTPEPTYPYPQRTYFPYDPSATVPDPPDYAVPIDRRPDAPVPEPVLTVQAERKHSPFEKHIARTIFVNSPSFTDEIFDKKLTIYVDPLLTSIDPINHSTTYPNATHGAGLTGISRAKFPYTPAFDGNTTLDDFTTAELNSPGMLQFIWSFVHELAHWWQNDQNRQDHTWDSGYREQEDRYRFNEAQLVANKFVDKEAHASAVATYAVIKWQLQNRPAGQLINITVGGQGNSRPDREGVGSVHRYMKIRGMDFQASPTADYATAPPVGTWITRGDAETLLLDFNALVTEITTAEPLPEPDEE